MPATPLKEGKFLFFTFIILLIISCAGGGQQNLNKEVPPCEDCRSGEESEFEVNVIDSHREKAENFSLDSGAVIGILPALSVIAIQPEKCSWCHSFSESAIDFNFAAIEDSLLAANFPNNERFLLAAEYPDEYKNLYEENSFKKIGQKHKVRYIAAAIFLKVEIIDKKTFIWESEWTLYDTKTDEFIFSDYQKKTAKSANSSPVDRNWAKAFVL